MAIFALITTSPTSAGKIATAVTRDYAEASLRISDLVWLVADTGSAKDVSDRVGVTGDLDKIDSTIVLEVGSYYGRSSPAIWSWIKNNWEATASG